MGGGGGGKATHLTSPFLSTEKANKCTFCTKSNQAHIHRMKAFTEAAGKEGK